MNFLIHFLLISSISILIGESNPVKEIKADVQNFIATSSSISKSSIHKVKLLPGGLLGETLLSLVWRGTYEGNSVAVKINSDERDYQIEMKGFEALNATNDKHIESHGIPRIYFHGKFLRKYYAIAMTLLDGTLEDRVRKQKKQKKKISELSILLIFRRAVEILEYLNDRNVIHNDIKPANIFLRGNEVFLSDFNAATLNGTGRGGVTEPFASSKYFMGQIREPIDDLESLVFSLWCVAGIEWDKKGVFSPYQPEGKTLADCKVKRTAEEKIKEKCKRFKDSNVQEAFRIVCTDEMLSTKPVPDYRLIINILTDAIGKVHGGSGTPQFEWLDGASSSA